MCVGKCPTEEDGQLVCEYDYVSNDFILFAKPPNAFFPLEASNAIG